MDQAQGVKYDTYVAKLYDTYVNTAFDVSFFLYEAKGVSGDVLELMSGTGRVSIPLVEVGVQLACVDNSPEMLAVLREKLERKNLSASVRQMDVRSLDLGKQFDLIFIPFHSFSELLTESDQLKTLAGIYKHLANGGRFICTLHNPPVRLKHTDGLLRLRRRCELDHNEMLLVWGLETLDQDRRVVRSLQLFEEYDASKVMRRRTKLELQFCPLSRVEFEQLAKSAGFRVMSLHGDYAHTVFQEDTSPFMVWVLEKA
jgi:SAM-dependent methyltransferase